VTPNRHSLWRAYAIAPVVAPLAFCALLALLAAGCVQFGWDCNGASFIVLPITAVVIGVPVAYAVALLLMPLAFWLQSRNALTGYAVLAIALGVTAVLAAGSPLVVTGQTSPYAGWIAYVAAGIGPPILLAAWIFHRVAGATPDARSRFPVLRVVLGVAGIAFVVAMAIALPRQPRNARTDDESLRAALRSTLRSLMTAEESFFVEYGTYTTDLSKLKERPDVPLDETPGVILSVEEATDRGWYATARATDKPTLTCWAYVGGTSRPTGHATREGEPACE